MDYGPHTTNRASFFLGFVSQVLKIDSKIFNSIQGNSYFQMTKSTFTNGVRLTFFTPAGFFVFCCLLAPPLLELIDVEITATPLNHFNLYTATPVLFFFAVATGVIWYTFVGSKTPVVELSGWEVWIASWYLINGFFFNSMMDVFAGQFQSWSGMTDFYNALEPRYAKVGTYDGVTVQVGFIFYSVCFEF